MTPATCHLNQRRLIAFNLNDACYNKNALCINKDIVQTCGGIGSHFSLSLHPAFEGHLEGRLRLVLWRGGDIWVVPVLSLPNPFYLGKLCSFLQFMKAAIQSVPAQGLTGYCLLQAWATVTPAGALKECRWGQLAAVFSDCLVRVSLVADITTHMKIHRAREIL